MKKTTTALLPAVIAALSAATVSGQTSSSTSSNSSLSDVFGSIVATGAKGPALGSAYTYAARPDFSQPLLSPQGTKVAMVARLADSVTTLLVVDVSDTAPKAIMKLDVPNMKSVQSFGWASETKLAVWLNMDTKNSSDDDPSSSLYMAQIDLTTKQVTERVQPTKMATDVEAPYPLSSELVRAPFRQPDHVLINECKRQGGVVFRQRGDAANYTFASTQSLPSSTIICQLLDWNLAKNSASAIVRPFYAYPTRFFVDASGNDLFAEGRKVGGKMMHGTITPDSPNKKKWTSVADSNPAELEPIWDNNELDNAELWTKIHSILKDRLDPAAEVVKSSNTGQAIGLQFDSPELRFFGLDALTATANELFNRTFTSNKAYAGSNIRWLGSTDDKKIVLFSVENLNNPGAYFIWRQRDNTIMRITDMRSVPANSLADNYLEPGWLPGYLPAAVTANTHSKVKGFVIMPEVMADDAANTLLRSVDMTAQWFAMNGLITVRVPVGLPATLPDNQRGDAWRKQIALRMNSIIKNLKLDYPKPAEEELPFCLYGRGVNAYAALAAEAFGSAVSCVIAINPKLEPKLFAQPYTSISTTDKTWYLSSDNVELRQWRSVYGADLAAGTPGNWTFPASADLMLSFEMFDENRTLATYASSLKAAVTKDGGKYTLYNPNLMAGKTDQWLSNQYDEMLKFILPPDAKKVSRVIVSDVEDGETGKTTKKK